MNLSEIRDTLQAHGYATDTATAQNLVINSVYRAVLAHRRWPWLQKQASLTLSADASTIDLSSVTDLRDIDALRVADQDDPQYANLQELRSWSVPNSTVRGYPLLWSQPAPTTLEVYPPADRAYDVTIDYIYTPPALSDDADVPVIPEQHHDVLVYGAIARMAIRERDASVRQLMSVDYELALRALTSASAVRQRQSTSQVVRSGFYGNNVRCY